MLVCEGDNSGEGKETVEPAEEANQKRGGRLLLQKMMGLGLGFFFIFF